MLVTRGSSDEGGGFEVRGQSAKVVAESRIARTGATLRWRPMLLGAVFKAIGQVDVPLASFSESKRQWMLRDLLRGAERFGVPFQWP